MIKNKITIGYIFESSPKGGGNFQTEISTAIRLKNLNFDNLEVKFFSTNKKNLEILQKYNFGLKYIKKKNYDLNIIKFYNFLTNKTLKKLMNYIFKFDSFGKSLISESIDIVHFNSMSPTALMLKKVDYGVSFWDMAHLDYTLFPESKENFHSISAREYIYKLLQTTVYTLYRQQFISYNRFHRR